MFSRKIDGIEFGHAFDYIEAVAVLFRAVPVISAKKDRSIHKLNDANVEMPYQSVAYACVLQCWVRVCVHDDAHSYTPNDVYLRGIVWINGSREKQEKKHSPCAWSHWLQANNKTYHLPHIHIILSILLDEVEFCWKGTKTNHLRRRRRRR